MGDEQQKKVRVYLTRDFDRSLSSLRIPARKFNKAIQEIIAGSSASLGHKIHKKRVGGPGSGKRGGYRTISYYRIGNLIIFLYLYAKNQKDDIDDDEKTAFFKTAKEMDKLRQSHIDKLVNMGKLIRYIY
jgi:hypothetical protein